jgi:twitching motility protein PilT
MSVYEIPVVPTDGVTHPSDALPAMPVRRRHTATSAFEDAPDRDLLDALQRVVVDGASDLHIAPSALPAMRIDGRLRPVGSGDPWSAERVQRALYSVLTPAQRQEFEENRELDFAYELSPQSRFRVNYYWQREAAGGAFRLIPTTIKSLDELGMPPQLAQFATLPRGLVLVTGPTGSGKSTTLASLVDLANSTRDDHIVTIEDPIEYTHSHKRCIVSQREVGHDTKSFAEALKHVLRQDPDIIMIGEMRDLETIQVALTAAETGHLVFATLHTQDAPQTIDRVIDVFPPHQQQQIRAQLAASLKGVISQTLVPRASGSGRAVAAEVMITTPAIANLIREGKTHQITTMMQAGRRDGMQTLDQDLADLVNRGVVAREAALEKVQNPVDFDQLVSRLGGGFGLDGKAAPAIDFGDRFSGGGSS